MFPSVCERDVAEWQISGAHVAWGIYWVIVSFSDGAWYVHSANTVLLLKQVERNGNAMLARKEDTPLNCKVITSQTHSDA